MKNIVIGIEGLVGSGKTSICRELLQKIPNSILLHGGNLYRAIVYALMEAKKSEINLSNLKESLHNIDIKKLMEQLRIQLALENRETVIYVGDTKIEEDKLQSQQASLAVSIAGNTANNQALYAFGKQLIENYKNTYNIIVSGRDLMRIYPALDYHFFITASLEERVKRKCIQYNDAVEREKVKEVIQKRDALQEQSGYYDKYSNTIEVDVTNCKDAKESAEKVLQYLEIK